MENLNQKLLKLRFSLDIRKNFYSILAEFLETNIPASDAIRKIAERANKDNRFERHIYNDMVQQIANGSSISGAFKEWIPMNEYMLLEASENKNFAEGLRQTIYMTEATQSVRKIVRSSMVQPVLSFIFVFGILVMFRTSFVETLSGLKPIEEWDGMLLFFYEVSDWLLENIYFIILGVVLLVFYITMTIDKSPSKIREKLLDKIPPYSLHKTFNQSSFLIVLGSLLRANMPFKNSLSKIKESSSPYLAHYLDLMIDNVSEGKKDNGQAMNVGLLDKSIANDIEDRANLSSFERSIESLGRKNVELTIESVKKKMTIINSLLTYSSVGVVILILMAVMDFAMSFSDSMTGM